MARQRVISAVLTLKDKDFASGVKKATNSTKDMERRVKSTGNQVRNFASNARAQFTAFAGVVAGAFAVHQIKDFTVAIIESAAAAKATNSQFEQVFTGIEESAVTSLDKIAQETSILPNRLKGSFISMAAFAKTAGADQEKALSIAERATLAAADGAAFYDKSIESVSESLQSFLKGNFANDAALGISATEFTRNAAAAELFGKKYNDLSEIQKQETLLKMVEDGNKLSGALGQASREGDGFENVVGNLKQGWTDLKAAMGEAVLEPAVKGIQRLTNYLTSIDPATVTAKMNGFVSFMSTTFGPIVSSVGDILSNVWNGFKDVGGIEMAKSALGGFTTGLAWIRDNGGLIITVSAGVLGAIMAFRTISGIVALWKVMTTAMVAYRTVSTTAALATLGLNTALLANPFTWVAVGIGALIVAGIALYRNWDTVKAKAGELWEKVKEVFSGIFTWGVSKIAPVISYFKGLYDTFLLFKNSISSFKVPKWVSTIGGAIGSAASKVGNFINGSHATGLNSVPFDGYIAQLHKGEMVVPARQAQNMREQGRTIDNADKASTVVRTKVEQKSPTININIQGFNKSVNEIVNELVPVLKTRLANL